MSILHTPTPPPTPTTARLVTFGLTDARPCDKPEAIERAKQSQRKWWRDHARGLTGHAL